MLKREVRRQASLHSCIHYVLSYCAHLRKFGSRTSREGEREMNFTSHYWLCIQNRVRAYRVNWLFPTLRLWHNQEIYFVGKIIFPPRRIVPVEQILEILRFDCAINYKFAHRASTDTKARQSASGCVHAEVPASVDNSWLQAYVGDLMARVGSWGRSRQAKW